LNLLIYLEPTLADIVLLVSWNNPHIRPMRGGARLALT